MYQLQEETDGHLGELLQKIPWRETLLSEIAYLKFLAFWNSLEISLVDSRLQICPQKTCSGNYLPHSWCGSKTQRLDSRNLQIALIDTLKIFGEITPKNEGFPVGCSSIRNLGFWPTFRYVFFQVLLDLHGAPGGESGETPCGRVTWSFFQMGKRGYGSLTHDGSMGLMVNL